MKFKGTVTLSDGVTLTGEFVIDGNVRVERVEYKPGDEVEVFHNGAWLEGVLLDGSPAVPSHRGCPDDDGDYAVRVPSKGTWYYYTFDEIRPRQS